MGRNNHSEDESTSLIFFQRLTMELDVHFFPYLQAGHVFFNHDRVLTLPFDGMIFARWKNPIRKRLECGFECKYFTIDENSEDHQMLSFELTKYERKICYHN